MKYGEVNLGQIEALINKMGGETAIARVLSGELVIVEATTLTKPKRSASPKKPSLLEPVTTAEVGGIEMFTARDKFREGKAIDGVKIYWIGGTFKNNFLDKVEEAVEAETLKVSKLKKNSVDGPIMAELGAMKTETTLGQFWELLKKQGNGKTGALLVNGWANIAYIRDQNGVLWAVFAYWDSGFGWFVEALSVTRPNGWLAGFQVLSR